MLEGFEAQGVRRCLTPSHSNWMKTTLLTNLLIGLALALCGLCTYQWLRETHTREEMQGLHDTQFRLESTIQQHTNTIRLMDARVEELSGDLSRMSGTIKTNEALLEQIREERGMLEASNAVLESRLHAYTNAFIEATNRLYEVNESVRKQNEQMKEVLAQRDDLFTRLNESIREHNQVVEEYNNLVKKVQEFQKQTQPKQGGR